MLSGYFWPKTNLTRFEKCEHLKHLSPILTRLRNKETKLNEDGTSNGPGSIDYRKYLIISELIKDLDRIIAAFNGVKQIPNQEDNVREIIKLVRDLAEITLTYRTNYEKTLMTERNHQRETMNSVVKYSAYGAALATLPFTTIGGIAMLLFGAPMIRNATTEAAGLDDKVPESVHIIDELTMTLTHIGENLGLAKNWNVIKDENKEDFPQEYLCPILGKLMDNPVICSLDEQTYEKAAIVKWLTEHRTSPFNRRQLVAGQPVDTVLVLNRNLKDAIIKWRDSHPQLFDQEYQTGIINGPVAG